MRSGKLNFIAIGFVLLLLNINIIPAKSFGVQIGSVEEEDIYGVVMDSLTTISSGNLSSVMPPYLYSISGVIYFNETKLNETITDLAGGGGGSTYNYYYNDHFEANATAIYNSTATTFGIRGAFMYVSSAKEVTFWAGS